MHFRHRQTDTRTDTDIVYIHILHLAIKIVYTLKKITRQCTCESGVKTKLSAQIMKTLKQSIARCVFLVRDVYISRLCYDVSVRLFVTEVHWRIIANLGFKLRSQFTAHCGHGACGHEGKDHNRELEWRDHIVLC